MNWNRDKSLKLSKFCVYLFFILMVLFCFTAPWVYNVFIENRYFSYSAYPFLLITTYTAVIPATIALYSLFKLLNNIERDFIFEYENIKYLRVISWCCIFAGIICLISGLYDWGFVPVAVAAAFVGLILRVVKNVIAQACEIKQENDYTI